MSGEKTQEGKAYIRKVVTRTEPSKWYIQYEGEPTHAEFDALWPFKAMWKLAMRILGWIR